MKPRTLAFMGVALFVSFFLDKPAQDFFSLIKFPLLDSIMNWFSHEITVVIVLVIVSVLFLYEERKKRYIPALLISFFTGVVLSYLIKPIIMRPRPEGMVFNEISFSNISAKIPDYSFPSTHATAAFSVLPILGKEFSKVKLFWLFFSSMVAISRIYLNVHYLSDVVAGLMLGYIIGHYILKLEAKHGISKKFFQNI